MTALLWGGFILLVLAMLALDLGVFHRRAHVISIREALGWTAFWVTLALCFNVAVYFLYEHHVFGIGRDIGHDLGGGPATIQFLTGFVVEKSLSLDNIFVIALVFTYFGVPDAVQHRVLFWGVLGALLLRGIMIAAGATLLERFAWMEYVFGTFLILTAVKMFLDRGRQVKPERNPVFRLARRLFPVSESYHGTRFFTRQGGRLVATPLFLVLIMVESTDIVFAVDSIPAIFAVTRDPFLVFTSNVFAILGLRSLYFALAGALHRFRYLKTSLVVILAFVGAKMLLTHHIRITTPASLGVIAGVLALGLAASLLLREREDPPAGEA